VLKLSAGLSYGAKGTKCVFEKSLMTKDYSSTKFGHARRFVIGTTFMSAAFEKLHYRM
jgi:hypothetical protein